MSDVIGRVWPEWHVEGLLGQGSYGKVYRAVRSSHGHTSYAAIKVIEIPQDPREAEDLASSGMDEPFVRSYFEQRARDVLGEVALMETLKGAPNVVSVEDYQLIEQRDGVGWTVLVRMPLLESAKDRFARMGQPDAFEVARLGVDICKALSSCHAKGVIHRDVKPENIFFGEYGYLLGDFGIARRLGPGAGSAHTRAGAYPYMAPEVFAGRGYGSNVDTYSLGLVLYRYLNGGRMPFLPAEGAFTPADSERAVAMRLAGRALPAPKSADANLASIVLRATNPDPTKRFGSAAEMDAALQKWALGKTAASPTATAGGGPETVVLDPEETGGDARRASGGATRRTAPTPNAAQASYGPSGTVWAGAPAQAGQPGTGQQFGQVTNTAQKRAPARTGAGNASAGKQSSWHIWAIVAGIVILMLFLMPLSNRLFGWPRLPGPGAQASYTETSTSDSLEPASNAVSPGGFIVDDDVCTIQVNDMYFDDDGDLRCDFTITNHTDWVLFVDCNGDWKVDGNTVGCIWVGGAGPRETEKGYFLIASGFFSTTNIDDVHSITGSLKVQGSLSLSGNDEMQTFYDVNLTPSSSEGGNAQSGTGNGESSSRGSTTEDKTSSQDAEEAAASYDNLSGEYVTTGTVAGGYITSASLTDSEMILIGDLHETTESGAEGPSIGDKTWTFKVDGSSTFGYSADRSFHEQSREEFAETLESLSFVGLKLTIEDGTIVEARMFA